METGSPDPWYRPPPPSRPAPGGYYYPPGSPPPGAGQWGGAGYGPGANAPGYVPYAGYWARVGGLLIDGILVYVASLVYLLPAHAIRSTNTDVNGTVTAHLHVNPGGVVVPLVIGLLYTGLMIGMRGQTLGMMAVRVRATDAQSGQLIGFWRAVGRDLVGRVFSFLIIPAIIDLLCPLWDP
ncbi:MAG TPA: RDD family protein, partial [Acidimicrobiales bacterium]|nr:RDD family protein [Acidimicrobiales bacterium]